MENREVKQSMKTLAEYAGGDLRELVATYQWRPEDANGDRYDVDIEVRVYKDVSGRFQASPSHRVKTPRQATPYMSIEAKNSIEEAVRDCISGFKMFMGTIEETDWPPNEAF